MKNPTPELIEKCKQYSFEQAKKMKAEARAKKAREGRVPVDLKKDSKCA